MIPGADRVISGTDCVVRTGRGGASRGGQGQGGDDGGQEQSHLFHGVSSVTSLEGGSLVSVAS